MAKKEALVSYVKILNDFPNPIWRAGNNAKCDFFNKAWLEFTGRKMEQEVGDGWVEGVHKEDLNRCIKIYSENFKKRQTFKMEYRLKHKDGTYHWILDCGAPFFSESMEFMGYIGSCYDITEDKNHETELQKINEDLKKFNDLVIDRELKMVKLKQEVNSLLKKQGKPKKY